MFRFADVPLSLSGMTRIPGRRVFLRAPTMDDWAEWAELRARSRAFLTPWEPTWPEDSLGRDHFRRRLRQQAREWRSGEAYGLFVFTNAGRRHQSQQRPARRRPGGICGLLDGPALCRAGPDDRRLARRPALRLRRAQAAPSRGGLPAAQRAVQGRAGQGRLPRGGLGAPVPADQRPLGRPSAVRPAARRLRCAPESGPLKRAGGFYAQSYPG